MLYSYAINLQLFCDHRKLIRYYICGWPGSVFDSTVVDNSPIGQWPELFLSTGQWIMGDSGFSLNWWLICPFRQPAASIPHNAIFNTLFSQARCFIEHVNGMLKSRFPSLKGNFMCYSVFYIDISYKTHCNFIICYSVFYCNFSYKTHCNNNINIII